MRNAVLVLAATAMLSITVLTSPGIAGLVENGDFTANAAQFYQAPGYLGGNNPAEIAGWTHVGGNVGLNGNATSLSSSPFGPWTYNSQQSDPAVFAFLEGGSSISQVLRNLTPGMTYTVTYLDSCSWPGAPLRASIAGVSHMTLPSVWGFTSEKFEFVAGSSSETLMFTGGGWASAADVAQVDVRAVPEPSSLAMIGSLCSMVGIATAWRRWRSRRAASWPLV